MTENDDQNSDGGWESSDRVPIYGRKGLEIGFEEDERGYIYVKTHSTSYEFEVDVDQVKDFQSQLQEQSPEGPTKPDNVIDDDEINVHDNWNHVGVKHTGGGIWTRIFNKEVDGGKLEVAYRPDGLNGVSLGFYEESQWFHELDHKLLEGSDPDEKQAVSAAQALILRVEAGYYEIPPEGVSG